ncbi:MAG TPA: hypothetical protein VEA63_07005 [Opitutus sp.]|nr:hypothetical protein [Opitutus sp.]
MSWLTARAALAALLNGQALQVEGYREETLTCVSTPKAMPDAPGFPLAVVRRPASRVVRRSPGGLRNLEVTAEVDVMVAAETLDEAEERLEAWVQHLMDLVGAHLKFDGQTDVTVTGQEFGEFGSYSDQANASPFGFPMQLTVLLTDTETRGA